MLKITLSLFVVLAACHADPLPQNDFKCGQMPSKFMTCIGSPKFAQQDVVQSCLIYQNPCERNTCFFEKLGWLDDGVLNKAKISEYYDKFAAEHPAWAKAVEHAKANCFGQLPPQGYHLHCPAYDVMLCSQASFFKNVEPSQWSSSMDCAYEKQWAASCPHCPAECYQPHIPAGSCNACHF